MRRPFFRRLIVEQLEDRALTNLPFGQLGTPVFGLSPIDNAGLDGPSLVGLNAITRSAGSGQANSELFTHASGGHGGSTALSGIGHHCCSHAYIGESPQPGSPTITKGGAFWETASANQDLRSLGEFGSLPAAGFDSFADNSLDAAFPSAKNATPVLPGGGDAGISLHAGASDNAVGGGTSSASGSSSGIGGVSRGFLASAPGSFALATAPTSNPMILLPSVHNFSPVVAATPKPSPISPSLSPALAGGPLRPLCSDPLCVLGPAYVPVNADDDNGSPVTNGLPAMRDFSVSPINGPYGSGDPDLQQGTLSGNMLPGGGTWSITSSTTGTGAITNVWVDRKKSAVFVPPNGGTFSLNFYIEGSHESSALNDVTVTFTYTVPGIQPFTASFRLTVTPLIQNFTVLPNPDIGDPNNQTVTFVTPPDATWGLKNITPMQFFGTHFDASAVETNLSGDLRFIQNLMTDTNGYNRTVDRQGRSVGWLWTDGTGELLVPKQGQYPFLDVTPPVPDQSYQTPNFSSSVVGGTITISDRDAPDTGHPDDNQAPGKVTAAVDLRPSFRMYLAWRWQNQYVNDVPYTIFYPLAYIKWQVNFYAMPSNQIKVLQGVSADESYTRSNAPPPCMDLSNVTANNSKWVYP